MTMTAIMSLHASRFMRSISTQLVLRRAQIFVISSRKIQQRGYETLFAFTTANERSLFARIVLAAPKKFQVHAPSKLSTEPGRVS